jgi:hypothetical protein
MLTYFDEDGRRVVATGREELVRVLVVLAVVLAVASTTWLVGWVAGAWWRYVPAIAALVLLCVRLALPVIREDLDRG